MYVQVKEFISPELMTLDDIEHEIWIQLDWSAQSHRGPFHIGTLATWDTSNNFPQLRNIVIRRTNKDTRSLFFHTDIRSPKWKQMMVSPQIGLLFYQAASRVQIRMEAQAILHSGNDIAQYA